MGISGLEGFSVLAVGSNPNEKALVTGKSLTDSLDKISGSPDKQGLVYVPKGY